VRRKKVQFKSQQHSDIQRETASYYGYVASRNKDAAPQMYRS